MRILGKKGTYKFVGQSSLTSFPFQWWNDYTHRYDDIRVYHGLHWFIPVDEVEQSVRIVTPFHQGGPGFKNEKGVSQVKLTGDLLLADRSKGYKPETFTAGRWESSYYPPSVVWNSQLRTYEGMFSFNISDIDCYLDLQRFNLRTLIGFRVQTRNVAELPDEAGIFAEYRWGSLHRGQSEFQWSSWSIGRWLFSSYGYTVKWDSLTPGLPREYVLTDRMLEYPLFASRSGLAPLEYSDGDLVHDAVQACQTLDINSLAYSAELAQMAKSAKDLVQIIKDLAHPSPKAVANAYLSYKYGIRLTVKDTEKVISALKADRSRWNGSSKTYGRRFELRIRECPNYWCSGPMEWTRSVKIWYHPLDNWILSSFRTLADWDFAPTLENVWDLVPYSFVVDWFLPFDDVFNRIDSNTYLSTLDIDCAVWGLKTRTKINARALFPSASRSSLIAPQDIVLETYDRSLSDDVPPPDLHPEWPASFREWAAAGSLILQRFGK